jgi:hypothetical protein
MDKPAKRTMKAGGPYLAAAFFCETVIEDKSDGALSAIRMIDRIDINLPPTAPPDFPSVQNRLPVAIRIVLSFKTGDAAGDHTIRAVFISPSGKKNPPFEQTLPFPREEHGGVNIGIKTTIGVVKGGLFWVDVSLDGKRVTRMPLLISVNRQAPPESPPSLPSP